MRGAGGTLRVDRDLLATGVGAAVYSFSLGIATVALPLLALDAGYSKAAVGYLVSCSAVSQMLARMALGAVMRRYPDWLLVFAAGGFLAISCTLVAISAALIPFVIAELVQGVARGCFWTGSQTHVVRGKGSSVRRLAAVNLSSSVGLLAGPVVGGFIGDLSLALALYTAAGVALVAMIPPLLLDRLPPFAAVVRGAGDPVWKRPGVDVGCLAGVTAGTWRGMLSSYVPVALQHAGQSASAIGSLVAVANGASIAGAALISRIGNRRLVRSFAVSTLATGIGTSFIAFVATVTPLEVLVLAVSGLGAGTLQSIGPAIATDAVHPEERGDAIALAGTYRAAALFAAPLGVGASLTLMPLSAAVAVAGGIISLPTLLIRRARYAQPSIADPTARSVDALEPRT